MELTPTTIGTLLVLAIVLGIAALGVSLSALAGQRRVRHAYRTFSQGSREDVLTLLQRHIDEVGALRQEVFQLRGDNEQLRQLHSGALSRVGVVRYDAFEDMGGRLSFSAALLDEHGDGVVVTAINGRTDTRVYAKQITRGDSRHNLSAEEETAIEQARSLVQRAGAGPRRRRPTARRAPAPADLP